MADYPYGVSEGLRGDDRDLWNPHDLVATLIIRDLAERGLERSTARSDRERPARSPGWTSVSGPSPNLTSATSFAGSLPKTPDRAGGGTGFPGPGPSAPNSSASPSAPAPPEMPLPVG